MYVYMYVCISRFRTREISSLLSLQICVGLVLHHKLWRFHNSIFSGVGMLASLPTLKPQDQALKFVGPLRFDLPDVGGTTRSLRSRQHSSPDR
jgi:hypothetical protein